jgi:hypothetical protein
MGATIRLNPTPTEKLSISQASEKMLKVMVKPINT